MVVSVLIAVPEMIAVPEPIVAIGDQTDSTGWLA